MPVVFMTADDPTFFEIPADIQVNPVNTSGVMGKGIALEFKERWPAMFTAYVQACRPYQQKGRPNPLPGTNLLTFEAMKGDLLILNLATKDHWKDPSRYRWVEECLCAIRSEIVRLRPATGGDIICSVPALGCGNGKLEWSLVQPMFEKFLCTGDLKHVTFCVWPPMKAEGTPK